MFGDLESKPEIYLFFLGERASVLSAIFCSLIGSKFTYSCFSIIQNQFLAIFSSANETNSLYNHHMFARKRQIYSL